MTTGKVSVVGTGPGFPDFLTLQAVETLNDSDLIIGYKLYIELIYSILEGQEKEIISSAMGREVERCRLALTEAVKGRKVSLVSGGDSGIYGMAGLVLQLSQELDNPPELEIVPGVTAASAAAAVLGAPLNHDFAVISLSDLLTPWEKIKKRIHAAAEADYVIVIYNPRSKGRQDLLDEAIKIILGYRKPENAVGLVRHAGRNKQKIWRTTLGDIDCCSGDVDMATLVVIGNSQTYWYNQLMITPRGYEL